MRISPTSFFSTTVFICMMTFTIIATPSIPMCILAHILDSIVIFQSPHVPPTSYTLIGNSMNDSHTIAYDLTPPLSLPTLSQQRYTPYTEGFVPSSVINQLLSAVQTQDPSISSYFHDFFLTEDMAYIAFPGGLDQLFGIHRTTKRIQRPNYSISDDLGPMYVSSMFTTEDSLIVVGAKAHSYDLLIYTFDQASFTLQSHHQVAAPPHVMNSDHLFISTQGIVYFLGPGATVSQFNPFTSTQTTLTTSIEGTYLFPYKESFITLNHDSNTLYVDSPELNDVLTFSLPTPNATPIRFLIDGDYLTGLFVNPSPTLFTNYLSIYHLPSESWVYLLGVTPQGEILLTDIIFGHF